MRRPQNVKIAKTKSSGLYFTFSNFCVVVSSVQQTESGAAITDDAIASRAEPGSDVRTSVFWSPAASLLIADGALDPLTSAQINLDKFSGYYCRGSEAASLLLLSFSQRGG